MNSQRIIRTLAIFAILSANIGCDQTSKNIARQHLNDNKTISLLGDHLTLLKAENTGAFLSLGNNLPRPLKILLLNLLPLLVLMTGLAYILTNHQLSRIVILGMCFVIGGGIGNLYDRILFGSVTDFLHIDFVIFRTGIFNMADVSIMTGVTILLSQYVAFRRSQLKSGD